MHEYSTRTRARTCTYPYPGDFQRAYPYSPDIVPRVSNTSYSTVVPARVLTVVPGNLPRVCTVHKSTLYFRTFRYGYWRLLTFRTEVPGRTYTIIFSTTINNTRENTPGKVLYLPYRTQTRYYAVKYSYSDLVGSPFNLCGPWSIVTLSM